MTVQNIYYLKKNKGKNYEGIAIYSVDLPFCF